MLQLIVLPQPEKIVSGKRVESKIRHITNHYEYLLAVSTDSLAVINSKMELEKFIIKGNDNNAFLCACTDINHFLDCLAILEEMILKGINALNTIER